MEKDLVTLQEIYSEIRETLLASRNRAYAAVNFSMVQAYWQIGRIIVEHEQNGNLRAEYGKGILQGIATAQNGWHAVKVGSQIGWVSGKYSDIITG